MCVGMSACMLVCNLCVCVCCAYVSIGVCLVVVGARMPSDIYCKYSPYRTKPGKDGTCVC